MPVRHHRQILGISVEGRPIEGVFFGGDDLRLRGNAPLDTLFIGAFHGDEGISTQLLTRFIEALIVDGEQAEAAINFEERPTLIIPALNPDGLEKNNRLNANSVDLNRNWPTRNWLEENVVTIYYSGPSAASEPETCLLMKIIEAYQPQKIITVHSPYKVINFDGPARLLAEAMAEESGYKVVEDIGYATPGSFGTWAGKEREIPVITLELPDEADETPEQVWQDNFRSLLRAILF